jgi:hypothetical protein
MPFDLDSCREEWNTRKQHEVVMPALLTAKTEAPASLL